MKRLSALAVVHNAEALLPACLDSVAFADEIVVVLDRCTDGSKAIALAHGAKIVEGAWPMEGPRRNAGLAACSGDWILEIDADERATPALGAEIRAAIETAPTGAILVPFENRIGGVTVKHGWGAYNGVAAKRCLFAAGTKHWGEGRLHPPVQQSDIVRTLNAPMIHDVYEDLPHMYARLLRYCRLAAEDMVEQNALPRATKTARRVFSRFWKSYVSRQGRKEGFYGIALATYSALYPLLSHLMALELQRRGK
ncbi:MAG: glycosyltransferase [Alphaproteobacteria bacterium]|nr:glycosyltransferase [Alphaproteobacteria bacterium]